MSDPYSAAMNGSSRPALALRLTISLGILEGSIFAAPAVAAPPESPPARAQTADEGALTARDLELQLEARALLLKEKGFARLMPRVMVRRRVAILYGLVSSLELAYRAEELVRQVPGVVEVRNELALDGS